MLTLKGLFILSLLMFKADFKGCATMGIYLPSFIDKIYLGLLLAAPLGPVSLEMIKRGLTSGFWSSFSVRLGGGLANFLCLALTCFGLSRLAQFSFLLNILGFLGVFLLFFLGYKTISQDFSLDKSLQKEKTVLSGLLWGFYLAFFNPIALAFWPGIFASSLGDSSQIGFKDLIENSFILVGILLWGAGLSFVSSLGQKFFSFPKLALIARGSGFLILAYGFKSLYNMLERVNLL